MQTKKCSKCCEEKELIYFYKHKKGILGVRSVCKECEKPMRKDSHEKYYKNNKENIIKNIKNWQYNNQHKVDEYKKTWNKNNPEYHKNYYEENKDELNKKQYQKKKERLKTDPKFKFIERLRSNIKKAFISYSKNGKTCACKEYGIDFEAIYKHVGPRPNKSYHLDHIIPLSLFNLDNPEHVRLVHVPRNLRWLPGRENEAKGSKIEFQSIICSLQLRSICLFIGVDIFDQSNWL